MYLSDMSLEADDTVITLVFTPCSLAPDPHKFPFFLVNITIVRNYLPVGKVTDHAKRTLQLAFRNFKIPVPNIFRSFSHDAMFAG